jgi:Ser/Thr protein kinase RdoA (MazF antagonist)
MSDEESKLRLDVEIPLSGGRSTPGVVRVGNAVCRPIRAGSALARELLRHLEKHEFSGAPRFLGIDNVGREILSYLPGFVPPELGHFSDAQLTAAARLLRQFHDATLDCALRNGYEVVCHGDASPCNCVFVDGIPVALIDFDDAHPGSRLEDVGYAAWLWMDIGNDDLEAGEQGRRVADFFRCYGLDTDAAIPSIISAQIALAERTTAAEVREWSNDCRMWVERNWSELSTAVAARSNNPM